MRLNEGIEVPAGWDFVPLKRITRFGYGDALASDNREPGNTKVYGSNGAFDLHSSANTLGPCIILGRKGSYGKLQFSNEPVFAVDTTFIVDQRHTSADLRFLYYLLGVLGLDELSDDTAVPGLSREKAYQSLCPIPPLDTQRRIARFLDDKTARIDALIEKKRALLDQLAEKRQALITRAVTKGLNPDAPMKPSGIDWLGDIPAHWNVIALNKITNKITNGYVGPTRDIFVQEGVRYIQLLHIKENRILFKDDFFVTEEWSGEHAKSILRLDDVLIVQTGDIGQVAHVKEGFVGCNCHALIVCSPRQELLSGEFLSWILCSDYGQQFLHLVQTGALHPHLNCGNVKFFPVVIPPLKEQFEINDTVRAKIEDNCAVEVQVQRSVSKLEEYRSALITAAVTGQIAVLR